MADFNIVKLKEQGFCYGVNRAIKIVIDTINDETIKKPIYLLGNLVHNDFIHKLLDSLGIIVVDGTNRLMMLDKVPDYSTVIFSAHGVSDLIREKAKRKHLYTVDATCPYVEKTFRLVENASHDNDIYFIGKPHHPETEAVLELSDRVFLVDKNNIYNEKINKDHLKIAHQTTMSVYDIENLFKDIKEVYPKASLLDMICRVTEKRQKQLYDIKKSDYPGKSIIIVIGDKMSNNSTKLYELAKRKDGFDAMFIESIEEISLYKIREYHNIILASGTSTPEVLIDEIIDVLSNIDIYKEEYTKSKIKLLDLIKRD